MKTIGYAQMYSGMPNPERELTEEEANIVEELVSKLEIPYTGSFHPNMGFTGFGVSNEDWWVNSNFLYWCSVWKNGELKHYEDTVGLIEYLEEILTPMVEKHYEDMQKVMADYYENMFRVPEKEKI